MQFDHNCQLCKLSDTVERTVCMAGKGPAQCDVMIIGEAPGYKEDQRGIPFVGDAGKVLNEAISLAGIERSKVYITNAVKCRPPANRTPTAKEIRTCNVWLQGELKRVQPKFVLLLGNVAMQAVLGKTGIKKARGKPIKQDGRIYFPVYHPAFILRDPNNSSTFENDILTFADIIQFGDIPKEKALNMRIVDTEDAIDEMLEDLQGYVSSDVETTCLYPWQRGAKVVSFGFGTRSTQWIVPGEVSNIWSPRKLIEIVDRCTERLRRDCNIIGQNYKYDSLWIRVRFGVEWIPFFDTMLAHYMLDENDYHGLKYLAQKYLGAPNYDIDASDKSVWSRKNAEYLAHDLFYTHRLYFFLIRRLKAEPKTYKVFEKITMPCARLFTEIEEHGVYVDLSKMDEAERWLKEEIRVRELELAQYGDINWASSDQVRKLLFDKLDIEPVRLTPKGKASTAEDVLKQIDHPCTTALLKLRAAKQQLSFFIEGWKPYIVSHRIHATANLHGTVTGRLSYEHPNLQQTPRDSRIRQLITARPGWTLVEIDLSQIELRVAAEVAHEPTMMHAFLTGIDIHWLTALREVGRGGGYADEVEDTAHKLTGRRLSYADSIEAMLKAGPGKCTEIWPEWKEIRNKAKAINFGFVFGMWHKKFRMYARNEYGVEFTDQQSLDAYNAFFGTYTMLKPWHKKQGGFAHDFGYVETLTGRKRRLPAAELNEDTPFRREAYRQAINSPVQGFANELNLMAMLEMREEFSQSEVQMVAAVHDAILMEVKNEAITKVAKKALEIMRHPRLLDEFDIRLRVPIEAEVKIGPWGIGKDFHKWQKEKRLV